MTNIQLHIHTEVSSMPSFETFHLDQIVTLDPTDFETVIQMIFRWDHLAANSVRSRL